jgi:hypothetical protein
MAAIDKLVVSVEFNGAGIEDLKAAVVRRYMDNCLHDGLPCTRPLRDAVAAAVGEALAEIRTPQVSTPAYPPRQDGKAMTMDDVLEAQRKAYREGRMPNVRVEKSERQATPPDGNPYSDLPLSANPCRDIPSPKLLPRKLTAAEREMILASVREQYGARAEQAERERLAGQGIGSDESLKGIMFCPVCKSTQSGPGVIAGSPCYYGCGPMRQVEGVDIFPAEILAPSDVERAICVTLAEIGYPPAPRLVAALAARLVDEVVKAAVISPDSAPAIGRSQALRNLNWLLRNKFPPEKIDAGRIARLGISEAR